MKLYQSPTSPFARKVLLVLHETRQIADVSLVTVAVNPTVPNAEVSASNPLGKIPALTRPEGPTLYDSRVICEYLNARANAALYAGGWDIKVLEATADGIMEAAFSMSCEKRIRPEDKRWEDWIAGQCRKILDACAAIETRWMAHLTGPLNIGQIAVAAALGYVDLRNPETGWREANPKLTAWFEEFESRPAMQATRPQVR